MKIVYASIWWCGDDVCDCYQPQIETIEPNIIAGPPWLKRERIWHGEFVSGPCGDDIRRLRKELADKIREMREQGVKFAVNKTDLWIA